MHYLEPLLSCRYLEPLLRCRYLEPLLRCRYLEPLLRCRYLEPLLRCRYLESLFRCRYLEPLRDETFLSSDEVVRLVGNIQEIVHFQKEFLTNLEEAVEDQSILLYTQVSQFKVKTAYWVYSTAMNILGSPSPTVRKNRNALLFIRV